MSADVSTAFSVVGAGLLQALAADGTLGRAISVGGAFRVRSAPDLGAATPASLGLIEHVDSLSELAAAPESLPGFLAARALLIEAAGAGGEGHQGIALRAYLRVARGELAGRAADAARRYVDAFLPVLRAARNRDAETLERLLNLDLAYSAAEERRRARLMPLHPLMVEAALSGAPSAARLPPVVALCYQRARPLAAEGEAGFYHGEAERWPTISQQAAGLARAAIAWLASSARNGALEIDFVDVRFPSEVLAGAVVEIARSARRTGKPPSRIRARQLATSLSAAAWLSPCASFEIEGVRVSCEPSVRPAVEARQDALVFAVTPAYHRGRHVTARAPFGAAAAEYTRTLDALHLDPRPHALEEATDEGPFTAALRWRAPTHPTDVVSGDWRLEVETALAAVIGQQQPVGEADAACHVGVRAEALVLNEPAHRAYSARTPSAIPDKPESPNDHRTASGPTGPVGPRGVSIEEAGPGAPPQSVPDAKRCSLDSSVAASGTVGGWSRATLVASLTRSLGRAGYPNSDTLVADVVRDAVGARRRALRHEILRDVAEALAPILASGESSVTRVKRVTQALVDLGDLLISPSSARGAPLIEQASAAFVPLPGKAKALLLGAAESVLSVGPVEFVGPLRAVDFGTRKDAREELRFRGAPEVQWHDWARTPPRRTPEEALASVTGWSGFKGNLDEYEVFDPATPSMFYLGRTRRAALADILSRHRWAVAARPSSFGGREYRVFRRVDGAVTSAAVDFPAYLEAAAACCARADEAGRFRAAVSGDSLRVYFPPPRWLSRLVVLGEPAEAGDALLAWRLEPDVLAAVVESLRAGLWCDVQVL